MDGDMVRDFIEPLVRLGYAPKGDLAEIAARLVEAVPQATTYQLRGAVASLSREWKYQTFPTIKACLDAIEGSPIREVVGETRWRPTSRPSSEAPIVRFARTFVDEYEAADVRRREWMDRVYRGRYEAAKQALRIFGAA